MKKVEFHTIRENENYFKKYDYKHLSTKGNYIIFRNSMGTLLTITEDWHTGHAYFRFSRQVEFDNRKMDVRSDRFIVGVDSINDEEYIFETFAVFVSMKTSDLNLKLKIAELRSMDS